MRMYIWFILGAILFWGAYVPTLHHGQMLLNQGALRGFLCVGVAYFLTAVLVPLGLLGAGAEPWEWNTKGVAFATVAGVLGAAGALCIILAIKAGGSPIIIAPLVFAGAPIINTLISMGWKPPKEMPSPLFFTGLALAALGAYLALRFKPV
ncbi:MAG: hypothetical protein AAGC60_02495 [Acidobacteriota bacterium]